MEIKKDKVTITLEGNEVEALWNIVAFALDYNGDNSSSHCHMSEHELRLAKSLCDKLE